MYYYYGMDKPIKVNLRNSKKQPVEKWLAIANEFNKGASPEDIVKNPEFLRKDGEPHARGYVYWVIKRLDEMGLVKITRQN